MVVIQRPSSSKSRSPLVVGGTVCVGTVILFFLLGSFNSDGRRLRQQGAINAKPSVVSLVPVNQEPPPSLRLSERLTSCPYTALSDLSPEELVPHKGTRHMVDPPIGGKLTLVCCQTTIGPWNILVHHKWAPHGAARFVEMVRRQYFSSQVPLMRCLRGFLCQFGLSGSPQLNKEYRISFADDPNWLPEGPDHRENSDGVKRFAHGYLAYAGAGPNSRGNQFIVSLANVGPLAGGSPWEVPWGELVGSHSFEALRKVYTGYGEKGPTQGKISSEGITDEVRQRFPKLDYVTACEVVDEGVQEEEEHDTESDTDTSEK